MFDNTVQRIGFCCKYMHPDQTQPKRVLEELQRPFNTRGTTVQWLSRQDRATAEQRLWEILDHNIHSAMRLVLYVSTLLQGQRMVRLGSDILPQFDIQCEAKGKNLASSQLYAQAQNVCP